MKQTHVRIIGGLLAAVLGACASALGFSACADAADNCHNTHTCPPACIEAGDAMDEIDGCY